MNREALIIDGVRSPRGRGKVTGGLHNLHPQELLASVLNSLRARTNFEAGDVDDVITGCGMPIGDHSADIGRLAVLAAGWPLETPGVSINRYCGSGQQAVMWAAMGIMSGQQDVVVGSGVEIMSRRPSAEGVRLHDGGNDNLSRRYPSVPQGVSADLIATLEGFSRHDVDSFAATSQRRCAMALEENRFAGSVVPVYHLDGSLALDHDEIPRPGTTVETLGALSPSFDVLGTCVQPGFNESFDQMCRRVYPEVEQIDHVHGPGNSSVVADGASALLLTSADYARAHGLTPRARVVQTALAGADPVVMLTAPTPASERCLAKAGMSIGDIDLWEINEAFAVVPLKTMRDLSIDPELVNVNGGAIALGHPIGATGPMLIQTALDELERRDASTALITMCTGGGMATATIIERV